MSKKNSKRKNENKRKKKEQQWDKLRRFIYNIYTRTIFCNERLTTFLTNSARQIRFKLCTAIIYYIDIVYLKSDLQPNSATSNNMKLVHWPLMGGLLHLVQQGGDWVRPQPTQASLYCTKCNSPSINGQCTNHRIAV